MQIVTRRWLTDYGNLNRSHVILVLKILEAAREFPREFGLYWPTDLRSPKMQCKINPTFL